MTLEDIKAVIAAKLAGQGSAIDTASVLPSILEALCDTFTQADWNQTTATALDYIKNKPTIPAAQVQSDWSQADNTKADYIKNKPTLPSAADTLNALTLKSTAVSITGGEDLSKAEAATALGITGDELDDLMRGKYLRYSYNSGAVVLGVDSANGTDLMLGAAQVIVQLGASGYTIILSE